MSFRFAIIGGGLTATSTICQLVDRLRFLSENGSRAAGRFSIAVFEKSPDFGPGLPHSDRYVLPFHITNMCAKDMSVRQDAPDDFQSWVQDNYAALQRRFADLPSAFACPDCHRAPCRHYPRAIMGEYLKARFQEAVRAARKLGVAVALWPQTEVTDLAVNGDVIRLTARERGAPETITFDVNGALLATGHWFGEAENPNYFTSPWPAAELLAAIPEGEAVGVIGSSLSAIEAALTLTSDGRFFRGPSGRLDFIPSARSRKAVFYSRRGLLPRVRGRSGRRPNRYFTCEEIRRRIAADPERLTLSAIFKLLDRELAAAYDSPFDWRELIEAPGDPAERLRRHIRRARKGDGADGELIWQTVLVEVFPVVRDLYLHLKLTERKRFDQVFTTLFFMHAATQPVINAEKVLALMEAGILSVVKLGEGYRFGRDPEGHYQFSFRDPQGRRRRAAHRYVVDARGQPRSIESDTAELTRNLLGRGIVQICETQITEPAPSASRRRGRIPPPGRFSYQTGSVVVDPQTHRVVHSDSGGIPPAAPPIFAVGAMTRGQMIDASMAYGISRATASIADDLIAGLRC